ncbi:MAG: flagellar hook-basal body protein [Clostridiales bacterium]|nr:flagellar hook-basal body protein [Clostridiales bacterium]
MFRGFYTLTSDMLTQQRRLNVISNNMANVSTPGFKKDTLVTTTFDERLAIRTGSVDKSSKTQLGGVAMMRVADEKVTEYEQGNFDVTGRPLDVAIAGEGFFEVQTPTSGIVYTRNGSFTLDEEGYLYLQHIGRVLGDDGEPILLRTDKVSVETDGSVVYEETGGRLGKLSVVNFVDYSQLEKTGEGMFTNQNGANAVSVDLPDVRWKMLERSNASAMDEIVAMITSQRALQSAGEVLRMYDQLMQKAANDIGRI